MGPPPRVRLGYLYTAGTASSVSWRVTHTHTVCGLCLTSSCTACTGRPSRRRAEACFESAAPTRGADAGSASPTHRCRAVAPCAPQSATPSRGLRWSPRRLRRQSRCERRSSRAALARGPLGLRVGSLARGFGVAGSVSCSAPHCLGRAAAAAAGGDARSGPAGSWGGGGGGTPPVPLGLPRRPIGTGVARAAQWKQWSSGAVEQWRVLVRGRLRGAPSLHRRPAPDPRPPACGRWREWATIRGAWGAKSTPWSGLPARMRCALCCPSRHPPVSLPPPRD